MILGNTQVAEDSLNFEVRKYKHQVDIENKRVDLEEKKFFHLVNWEKRSGSMV